MSKGGQVVNYIDDIEIKDIIQDSRTQTRIELNNEVISEYAEKIKNGERFPEIETFLIDGKYYLVDGFHRVNAYIKAGKDLIKSKIYKGTIRDAILYSLSVNDSHGLRRSNLDKRKAVLTILKDKEWSQWSNVEIAKQTRVDEKTVRSIRNELENQSKLSSSANPKFDSKNSTGILIEKSSSERKAIRNGKEYIVKTKNIGKKGTFSTASNPNTPKILKIRVKIEKMETEILRLKNKISNLEKNKKNLFKSLKNL